MQTTLITLLVFVLLGQQPMQKAVTSQEKHSHPAFTLVLNITTNRPDGGQQVSEETRYVSSNGSVRNIRKKGDGTVTSDYLYESGKGGFYVQHEEKKLVKSYGMPPEASGKLPTAEQLKSNPNFVRTEKLLGYTAYVLKEGGNGVSSEGKKMPKSGIVTEYYYAPELGRTPLKVVRYREETAFSISEPVSVTFGEPESTLMRAPEDYAVAQPAPISGGVLNGKAISKPAPAYPSEAKEAGAQGTVTVQILVKEDGTVESAKAAGGHPLLQEAAVEAARKATFSPTILSGQPVKVRGVITYNFVLQ